MKRKTLALLSLLLAVTLLFTSCGALNFAKDLLRFNIKLISDGVAHYALRLDDTLSDTAKADADATLALLGEKTGVDLATAEADGENFFAIGLAENLEEAKDLDGLNDSNCFIGFHNGNFLLTAANETMLGEALRAFRDVYLSGEEAYVKEGHLSLSKKLALFSDTVTVFDDGKTDFVIIRPDTASELVVNAAVALKDAIKAATGAGVTIKSDFRAEKTGNAKEILIGATDREESAVVTDLGIADYAIYVENNRYCLVGGSDSATVEAVEHFISAFLTGAHTTADKETHQLLLPGALSYRVTQETVTLCEAGKAEFTVIYPSSLDSYSLEVVTKFVESLNAATDATFSMKADSSDVIKSSSNEILIGGTNRNESKKLLSSVAENGWKISLVSEHRLVVSGGSAPALKTAVEALERSLLAQVARINPANAEQKLLFLVKGYAMEGTTAPVIPNMTAMQEISEHSYLMYRNSATSTDYTKYLSILFKAGFDEYTKRTMGSVSCATYTDGTSIVNVTYTATDSILRACVDPVSESALPELTEQIYTAPGKKALNCEPLFMQLGRSVYEKADCGMSYVVRLCDGTFVIVDGGWTTATIAEDLYKILTQNNVLDGKPVISAWIFTHGHTDHIGAFITFSKSHANDVTLLRMIYSFPSEAQTLIHGGANVNNLQNAMRDYIAAFKDDTTIIKARTGQVFHYAGLDIEMLFTYEDYPQPRKLSFFNDSSLVFRFTLSQSGKNTQTFMMLGDASEPTNGILVARYGNYLACDAVQVAHHGYTGGTAAVYAAISAAVVFWPCPINAPDGAQRFSNPKWSTVTRKMLAQSYAKILYVAGLGDVILTLSEVKNRTIKGIGMVASAASIT